MVALQLVRSMPLNPKLTLVGLDVGFCPVLHGNWIEIELVRETVQILEIKQRLVNHWESYL